VEAAFAPYRTVSLYIKTPKAYFPIDDSGFVIGSTRASADISFRYMGGCSSRRQRLDTVAIKTPAE
jgi:multidrug efflux pump